MNKQFKNKKIKYLNSRLNQNNKMSSLTKSLLNKIKIYKSNNQNKIKRN